ncbi:3-beta-hydroxysteroid dehydrogenase [Phialemonium atrogriseum]|uniref:3-beta-hydroxysteroid dehydrogenase n=1 Tax=Phialemonium atrogriseum TaxID=1093897 RepID=A0AAJ0FJ42_9PEZI|nr:3-beta-hydroxysteroid dehydrogenase [Phialemonium atrogriseum]KAK1763979.1 3-beta-hydroxysteroid dehydrogenase [Phialemonium atrogriseum]
MATSKIAVITGGASGMGLACAEALSRRGWGVQIMDLNAAAGTSVAGRLQNVSFSQVNVNSWDSLSSAFHNVFTKQGKIDFVFANAGILQLDNFYQNVEVRPPPEPRQASIDINLKAVINTSYLAQHYFRSSKHGVKDPVLVMTASIASFYAQEFNPLYTASKAGVLGFMRSIAAPFYHQDGIRTYAICPGTVRTNLLDSTVWDTFPEEHITPVETVVSAVEKLVAGGRLQDDQGKVVEDGENYGLAVEVFGRNMYFRDQMEYINDGMRQICEAASLEHQQENLQ